jgi:predicted transposase YdaD
MSEDLAKEVAGLSAEVKFMLEILKDIQKDLKFNHMPLAHIEEKFRNQGERIGNVEIEQKTFQSGVNKRFEEMARATELKELEIEMKRQLTALALENEKRELAAKLKEEKVADVKRESPYKIIGAIGVLVGIIAIIIPGVAWLLYHIK